MPQLLLAVIRSWVTTLHAGSVVCLDHTDMGWMRVAAPCRCATVTVTVNHKGNTRVCRPAQRKTNTPMPAIPRREIRAHPMIHTEVIEEYWAHPLVVTLQGDVGSHPDAPVLVPKSSHSSSPSRLDEDVVRQRRCLCGLTLPFHTPNPVQRSVDTRPRAHSIDLVRLCPTR